MEIDIIKILLGCILQHPQICWYIIKTFVSKKPKYEEIHISVNMIRKR